MLICGVFRLRAPLQFYPCAGPSFARRSEPREGGQRKNEPHSQLLAGPLIGSGGSSGAARVSCCDKTRGRRTPSRISRRLAKAPLNGRGGALYARGGRRG